MQLRLASVQLHSSSTVNTAPIQRCATSNSPYGGNQKPAKLVFLSAVWLADFCRSAHMHAQQFASKLPSQLQSVTFSILPQCLVGFDAFGSTLSDVNIAVEGMAGSHHRSKGQRAPGVGRATGMVHDDSGLQGPTPLHTPPALTASPAWPACMPHPCVSLHPRAHSIPGIRICDC